MSLQGRARDAAVIALCLLAVPWIPVWIAKKLFLATLLVVAALLLRLRPGVAVAFATLPRSPLRIYLLELFPPAPFGRDPAAVAANALAQSGMGEYVAALRWPEP